MSRAVGAANLLQATNVHRRYSATEKTIVAVDGVTISVGPGEFAVVQGPSGCGKSTLLCLLGLLDRPECGEIELLSTPTSGLSDDDRAGIRRRSVGYLFQDGGLIDRMSVCDNVALPLRYQGASRREQRRLVERALDRVGLLDRAQSSVGQLSGGQRQRVGLARAIVAEPPILLCDEPTASLDAANGALVADLLISYAATGAAVICSSHDPIVTGQAGSLFAMDRGVLTPIFGEESV